MAWKFEKGQLLVTIDEDETEYAVLCERVEIVRKIVSLSDGVEKVQILITKPYPTQPFWADRDSIARKNIMPLLTAHGLSIDSEDDMTVTAIKQVLNETEDHAPVEFFHSQTGFRMVNNQEVFLAYNPIGPLDPALLESRHENAPVYEPKGSHSAWLRYMNVHVCGNPALELALALSVSAPVACILKKFCVFTDLPLFGLIGTSSTGKTTVLQLMASVWGNPQHLVSNFSATPNALAAMLEECGGLPYLADEATYTAKLDWDALLYTLPTGRTKRRCNSNGTLKPAVEYSGAMILSSERSILARSKGYDGQSVRLIEFSEAWFGEAIPGENDPGRSAERLRSFVLSNYGCAGTEIMRYLIQQTDTRKKLLVVKFRAYYRELCAIFSPKDGMANRFLQRAALILASAWLIAKVLPLEMHVNDLANLLAKYYLKAFAEETRTDPADKLYEAILAYTSEHQSKFPPKVSFQSDNPYGFSDVWGMIEQNRGGESILWISKDVLKAMLPHRTTFEDVQAAVDVLKAKGYLKRKYDRFLVDQMLGKIKVKCYGINIPTVPKVSDESTVEKTNERKIRSNSKIKELLSDE